jgi:hypothetical protein
MSVLDRMTCNAAAMTEDQLSDALGKVADYALDVGLYGVMILSPKCPRCGACHDFALTAGAVDESDANKSVRALLLRFADVAVDSEPVYVDRDRPRGRQ